MLPGVTQALRGAHRSHFVTFRFYSVEIIILDINNPRWSLHSKTERQVRIPCSGSSTALRSLGAERCQGCQGSHLLPWNLPSDPALGYDISAPYLQGAHYLAQGSQLRGGRAGIGTQALASGVHAPSYLLTGPNTQFLVMIHPIMWASHATVSHNPKAQSKAD